jgi:voltage-gated potassium channel
MQRLRRSELSAFARRMAVLFALILALLVLGTAGFVMSEDVSVWLGFQWALDTVATVGSVPAPADTGGQIVKVVLIMLGVGTLFYALVTVTEFFVAGHLGDLLAERRTQKMIDALSDHYIICGFGRVGRQVARDLRAAGARYVVIDETAENRELAVGVGVRIISGKPSDDEALRAAGVERARGVIACVDSDAENIFITLTARELNPRVAIVARASVEDSESKLRRAGANRVISPYKASGTEMARLALNPQVSGVVDVAPEYRMEEIHVMAGCDGAGQTIGDVRGGAMIVGVRRQDGTFQPMPPGELMLAVGDVLVAMGTPRTMDRLERLFDPARAGARAE